MDLQKASKLGHIIAITNSRSFLCEQWVVKYRSYLNLRHSGYSVVGKQGSPEEGFFDWVTAFLALPQFSHKFSPDFIMPTCFFPSPTHRRCRKDSA
jgi:hypothetical protein